jgi:hypothetical protein
MYAKEPRTKDHYTVLIGIKCGFGLGNQKPKGKKWKSIYRRSFQLKE